MATTADADPWFLIIDAQRIFADPSSPWASPSWDGAWERIRELARAVGPERTLLTRWLPTAPRQTADGRPTAWAEYFAAWSFADVPAEDPLYDLVDGAAELSAHPSIDLPTFGKWGPQLRDVVGEAPALLVGGVATDCCVISTVLSAADAGARITVDAAACAASDEPSGRAALHTMGLFAPHVQVRGDGA